MTTLTPAVLITGHDENRNEYAYTKIEGEWFDVYRQCVVGNSFMAAFILPNVIRVRFGKETMTRQEWEASGTPYSLSDEELQALAAFHAEPETKPVIRLESSVRVLRTFDDLPIGDQTDASFGQMDDGTPNSVWEEIKAAGLDGGML